MTTSPTATWLTRPEAHVRTPRRAEAFAEARNRGQLHQLIVGEFLASKMSQSNLAKRTGKPRETISRALGHPTNMEIDTASKILYALTGKLLAFSAYDPFDQPATQSNMGHRPGWADQPIERRKPATDDTVNKYMAAPTTDAGQVQKLEFRRLVDA
jgi:DNA-binding phage protein